MPPKSRLRLLLLIAVGLVSLLVRFVLLTPFEAAEWITQWGYWTIAAIVAVAVVAVFRALRGWRFSLARHGWPLVASIACALFLQLHEPRKLKVLFDEYVIATVSLQMHLERMAAFPAQAQYDNGRIVHFSGFVDKRPLLFPFLVSLLHDVSGYRVSNVFLLNGLISVVLFWFVFWLGEAIGGRRFGYAGMLLVAGIPLVANVATSGIFDLLNLALLAGLMLAARRYVETPSGENQSLLVMAGVLIAQARYESILFLFPLAAIVAVIWVRTRRVEVTWFGVASPLMLLPPLLFNLLHVSYPRFTQNQSVGVELFEIANVGPNLGRDLYYLFDLSGLLTNSPLVSYAGIVSLILVIVGARSLLAGSTNRPGIAGVFLAFIPVVMGIVGITLFYWWGQFDDPMVSRLSLPLQLALVIAILFAVAQFRDRTRAGTILIGVASIGIWAWTVPTNARHATTLQMFTLMEVEWQVKQVLERFDYRTLVVCDSALPLVAHRRPAIPIFSFNENPRSFWELKTRGLYEQIVFFQTFQVDPATGSETDVTNCVLPKNLKLELIAETRFKENYISRFSRWSGFKEEADGQSSAQEEGSAIGADKMDQAVSQSVTAAGGTSMP